MTTRASPHEGEVKSARSGDPKQKPWSTDKKERKPLFFYLGWKDRKNIHAQYIQVRLADGGGIRRHPYGEDLSLDDIKKVAMKYFLNEYTETDFLNAKVGNFMGEEIDAESNKPFVLEKYVKKSAMFTSRVRLYLLTTDAGSPAEDGKDAADADASAPSGAKKKLCISGKYGRNQIYFELVSMIQSRYSGEFSTLVLSSWNSAFDHRSDECLDQGKENYDPLADKFVVTGIEIDKNVYLKNNVDDNVYIFSHPTAGVVPEQPVVLHGPDEVNGYEDDDLFIGVVTNFHNINALGTMFTWSHNGNGFSNGHNQCVVKVTEPGTYYCKVLYYEVELISSAVRIVHSY